MLCYIETLVLRFDLVPYYRRYYLPYCHHFSHHRVDLINSVKSICDNFDSMRDNVKEDLLLFGDSWFDGNKNKVIREANYNLYKKSWKIFWFPTWIMFCYWMISTIKLIMMISTFKLIMRLLSYYAFSF